LSIYAVNKSTVTNMQAPARNLILLAVQSWVDAFLKPAGELARSAAPVRGAATVKPAAEPAAGALEHVLLGHPHYSPFYRVHTTVYVAFLQHAAKE
jgi:hypothetical protein